MGILIKVDDGWVAVEAYRMELVAVSDYCLEKCVLVVIF